MGFLVPGMRGALLSLSVEIFVTSLLMTSFRIYTGIQQPKPKLDFGMPAITTTVEDSFNFSHSGWVTMHCGVSQLSPLFCR